MLEVNQNIFNWNIRNCGRDFLTKVPSILSDFFNHFFRNSLIESLIHIHMKIEFLPFLLASSRLSLFILKGYRRPSQSHQFLFIDHRLQTTKFL